MDDPAQLSEYGKILLLAIVGLILVCGTILLAKFISSKKPNPVKLSTYECGEDAIGTSWVQFNPRFYVIALIFLLFDVELIFVFPWATVFGNVNLIAADSRWGWFTMIEMGIFLGILVVGLVYVWKKGDLKWVRPRVHTPQVSVNIPASAYDNINEKVYEVRDHRLPTITEEETKNPEAPAKSKLGFKPRFKKGGEE